LVWQIDFGPRAERALKKLDRQTATRLLAYIEDAATGDPRARGKALTGELSGFWRYRVGDWRVICRIEDARLVVLVIDLGHRREVYR
jgi:mRNA interferase RelE/StbE